MKISELSYSPSAMFLDGVDDDMMQTQALRYQIDKKTLKKYVSSLEIFYSKLIEGVSQQESVISKHHWLVLCKSMMHVFLVLLIDSLIINKAQDENRVIDDVDESLFLPQTQENLNQALLFDRDIASALLKAAFCIANNKKYEVKVRANFFDIHSVNNWRYFLTKKITKVVPIPSSTKPMVALAGAGNLASYLENSLKTKFDLLRLDEQINQNYRSPKAADKELRSILQKELRVVLENINLANLFPVLKDKKSAAGIFSKVIVSLLPVQILERYEKNASSLSVILDKVKPKLVITSSGHHDDLASLFLSICAQQKVPIITFQHGSGYAEYMSMQTERAIEMCLYPSSYLSWGGGMPKIHGSKAKIVPVGSPYLNALPVKSFKGKKIKRILIPLEPIYFYQALDGFTPSQPGFVPQNYKTIIDFMEQIHELYPEIVFILKMKLGHKKQEKIIDFISTSLNGRTVISTKGKTYDYFDDQTLVFLPNLSGAFHEALMSEVPFILYLPQNQRFLRTEVDPFFDLLSENHLCAESVEGLVEAFKQHANNEIAYSKIRKQLKKYQDFACMRNKYWEKMLKATILKTK